MWTVSVDAAFYHRGFAFVEDAWKAKKKPGETIAREKMKGESEHCHGGWESLDLLQRRLKNTETQ